MDHSVRIMLAFHRSVLAKAPHAVGRRPSPLSVCPRKLSTAHRRPVLPAPREIRVGDNYVLKHIDIQPPIQADKAQAKTIVLLHGSPGSFQDYKYLIPHLQGSARIIGLNLPGNGDSVVLDKPNYYDHIRAVNLAHAAVGALTQLCGNDENVFVIGHSFGGHATINVAALNEMDQKRQLNIRGIGVLASAGLRIHRALELTNLNFFYSMLSSDHKWVEAVGRIATRALYTRIWRFPSNESTEHYVAGLVRCASTDFALINDHVARIRHLPAFCAWAKDDLFIQEEIFQELSDELHPGPRFSFTRGGHNIQKTKAEFLARHLLEWTHSVLDGSSGREPRATIEYP